MTAKAEKGTAQEVSVREVGVVTLELTLDVAETLHQVVRKISGSPREYTHDYAPFVTPATARKFTDEISEALRSAGVRYADHPCEGNLRFTGFEEQ